MKIKNFSKIKTITKNRGSTPLRHRLGLVPYTSIVIVQESRPMTVYILSSSSTHQGTFSGQNRDGAPTSKADNTSNAVIDPKP